MTMLIASAEIVSAIFMVIILCGLYSKNAEKTLSRRLFTGFVIATTISLVADATGYIMDNSSASRSLLIVVNALSFLMIDICISFYAFYLLSRIKEKKEISYASAYIVTAICGLDICGIILGIITGNLFYIEGNKLIFGPWREYTSIMPLLGVLILLAVLIMNSVHLERRHALALGTFTLFPMIAAMIIMISPELELAYLAAALSSEVIFIFIQHDELTEACVREQVMERLSSVDTLTGLKNRRGYDEAIEACADHASLGVFFCDLNALKFTNDTFGHAAGDAYIKRFADILRRLFDGKGEICRISGDEFVVLLYDVDEEQLKKTRKELARVIYENDRIASMGCAYGEHRPALELVRDAEHDMYDDKKRYYEETGRERRRQK